MILTFKLNLESSRDRVRVKNEYGGARKYAHTTLLGLVASKSTKRLHIVVHTYNSMGFVAQLVEVSHLDRRSTVRGFTTSRE